LGGQVRLTIANLQIWLLQSRCNHQAAYVDQWKHLNLERVLTALADMRLEPGNAHRQVTEPQEIERSLEKSHIWPQSDSGTRSGLELLKKISDYLDSGADSPQLSSQRTSLAFEKANTIFKPTVFRRPGSLQIRLHFYVISRCLQSHSLHPPFFGG